MKKSTRNSLAALALAASFSFGGNLSAQMGGMGGGMSEGGMGGGMMMHGASRMHVYQPMHILHHGEPLGLSEAQRAELTAIMERANAAQEENQASHDRHMGQMTELLGQPGASAADIQAHFAAAHAAGGAAHWAKIEAAVQAVAVLNESQRARVDGWGDMMDMMQMHRGMAEGHEGMGGMDHEGDDDDGEGHDMDGMGSHES